jgi:hypothetical protein
VGAVPVGCTKFPIYLAFHFRVEMLGRWRSWFAAGQSLLTSCANLIDDNNGRVEGTRLVNVRCDVLSSGNNMDPIAEVRIGCLFKLVNPSQEKI